MKQKLRRKKDLERRVGYRAQRKGKRRIERERNVEVEGKIILE